MDVWQKTRAVKDNLKSETFREAGNKLLLQSDQPSEAVEAYNEAILFAEWGSLPYALALANRAVAWMKVKVGKII